MAYIWTLLVLLVALAIHVDFSKGSLLDHVTCGSVLKLANVEHGFRLHSHEIRYGSGSGQQSVTGLEAADDVGSYWRVRAKTGAGAECRRGAPVKCGATIRLTHLATGKNLHSHLYSSPITGQQEVSAYGDANGEGDRGDDWTLVCDSAADAGDGLWRRDRRVRLRHAVTEQFLHASGHRFGRPIAGHGEISAVPVTTRGSYWLAAEGVYVKSTSTDETAGAFSEAPTVERPRIIVGGLHDSGEL